MEDFSVKDWLGEDNNLGISIWENKYRHNDESFGEWLDRVSAGDKEVKELILAQKFLPGGRILANRGLANEGTKITYSNCFVAGTKVLTKQGYKSIEDIRPGELVLTHDNTWQLVNEVMSREYEGDLYEIRSADLYEPIVCTPNHKFLTNKDEWKAIEDFRIKSDGREGVDKLVTSRIVQELGKENTNTTHIKINEIIIHPNQKCSVYNLSVENNHSYMVNGVFAHNCYVISPPEDNIESIYETTKKLARTYSYGGGCGISISKLSPRNAKIRNAAKTTSGAVSFMDTFSQVTEQIGQNGRRAALMISIDCTHPDLEEFIDIKKDLNKVTKANISIQLSDEFMKAVRDSRPFKLYFKREETGEVIEKEVDARKLFMKIAENNWEMGEPGCLFWDTISEYNLLSEYDDFSYAGVNP